MTPYLESVKTFLGKEAGTIQARRHRANGEQLMTTAPRRCPYAIDPS
jgi:hypothetical protein